MTRKKVKYRKQGKTGIPSHPSSIIPNLLTAQIGILLLFLLLWTVPGYSWLVQNLVVANMQQMWEYPDATLEQKYEHKLGINYRYLKFVQQQTPEDAVILMPPDTVIAKSQFKDTNTLGIRSKSWCSYFLYPRVLVSEDEKESLPELYQRVTHVMIIDSWGYDKLTYSPEEKPVTSIFPIDAGEAQP